MANWQFKLNLNDIWKKEGADLHESARTIVERLTELCSDIRKRHSRVYQDMADELENDIIPLFEEVRDEHSSDVDDFDNAMEALYDWGDTALDEQFAGKKMCWIGTMFPA